MTDETHDEFEYEVALSFASEDRGVAEALGNLLAGKGIKPFYDEYLDGTPWGDNMLDHLINIYSRKARYCVIFISQHYPLQKWTEEVRSSVQELTLRDANEHIIPVRLGNHAVPGISETSGYSDLRQHSMEEIATMLERKLAERIVHPGPPPESHDLRSGNVPSPRNQSKAP